MRKSIINISVVFVLLLVTLLSGCTQEEWIPLFDGESLQGWKPSENTTSWQIVDGAIVTKGSRSHLFYDGDVLDHNFKNFELSVDVKTEGTANSGIYFHTEYQEEGWPEKGFEFQVHNTFKIDHQKPDAYVERKMTGSLYGVRNIGRSPVKTDEWFNYRIVVQGKTIRAYVNDELMVDYTEPENPYNVQSGSRVLSSGTFALQCHDPESIVHFKNIKVKPLSDNLETSGEPIEDIEYEARLREFCDRTTLPLSDLHGHLKQGLTPDQMLEHARKYGITYGIAFNCGLKMGFEDEDSLNNFLDSYERPPGTFLALQAEGREWLDMFSENVINRFDYVFTDAMTWTNNNGKRMRLWIPEETEVGDPDDFMDQLVNNIVEVVSNEPIDIYVNATYLPEEINDRYDELWTEERMDRVIAALVESEVAMEISARFKIPSAAFVKKAKAAGVKFTFGTNNAGQDDLGRLEYCIDVAEECELGRLDFWYPTK